jgi:hypothetical protein
LDSPVKVILPVGEYEISGGSESESNEYIYSKSDRWIVLNFKWEELSGGLENTNTTAINSSIDRTDKIKFIKLRFRIKAEYVRLETKKMEYITEIKFKI